MKALVNVTSVEITCPKCLQEIASPSGSLFWTTAELPERVKCFHCNEFFSLPKAALRSQSAVAA